MRRRRPRGSGRAPAEQPVSTFRQATGELVSAQELGSRKSSSTEAATMRQLQRGHVGVHLVIERSAGH